jgi:hypothetical protein
VVRREGQVIPGYLMICPKKDGIFAVLDENNKKNKEKHVVYSLDLLYDISNN